MEIEQVQNLEEIMESNNRILRRKKMKGFILLFFNIILLLIGGSVGPLVMRLYFIHGGKKKWFSAFLQTAGFPLLILPIFFSFIRRRRNNARILLVTPTLFFYCAILGIFTGIDDYLYSYGLCFLPVSTSSLLMSTQLGFTAIFAFLIVKQKFNFFTVSAVVLLTLGAVVLSVDANGDMPKGESKMKYYIGFVMILTAAILYAMVLPLVELMYKHAQLKVSYMLVMEMQFIIGFFASLFCAVGMLYNKDFQGIPIEGKHYELGEAVYYIVVFFCVVLGQVNFLGSVGTIKYSSALLGAIIMAICIPITEILAVFFFHEKFSVVKGVALALSLWGTSFYFYGEYKKHNKSETKGIESQVVTS